MQFEQRLLHFDLVFLPLPPLITPQRDDAHWPHCKVRVVSSELDCAQSQVTLCTEVGNSGESGLLWGTRRKSEVSA